MLLAFDIAVLSFVIGTSFLQPSPWVDRVDFAIGVALLLEFAARILSSRTLRANLLDPWTLLDAVAIGTFLLPVAGESLGFLRALRLPRVMRLFRVLDRLRAGSAAFRRNEEAFVAATNLLVFVFVMTGLVYATQHRINPQIKDYADALYFTIDQPPFGDPGKMLVQHVVVLPPSLVRVLCDLPGWFSLVGKGLGRQVPQG